MLRCCLRYMLPLLAMGVLALACSDDDSGSPTGLDDDTGLPGAPEDSLSGGSPADSVSGGAPVDSAFVQAATVFRDLESSVTQAIGLMGTGGTLTGEQGEVRVVGTTFTLDGYSPNGLYVLDGELTFDMMTATIVGTMAATGALEGEVEVHITVDLSTGVPVYGGTVKLGDETYQVSDLAAGAAGVSAG